MCGIRQRVRIRIKRILIILEVFLILLVTSYFNLFAEVIPLHVEDNQAEQPTPSPHEDQYPTGRLYMHEWIWGALFLAATAAFFILWSERGK